VSQSRTFEHSDRFQFLPLTDEITERGRVYTTPEGNKYPSVTTVIGGVGDHSGLDEWRARVGEEEAKLVSRIASKRGTAVHETVEKYLKNDLEYLSDANYATKNSFRKLKPALDKHMGTIFGLEVALYSDKLRCAGRVDNIAEWDGELSIVDFKTSRNEKQRDWITNYFLQESAYAYFFYERTGVPIGQLVTVITVDDGSCQVFVERTRDWIEKFFGVRKEFGSRHGW